MSRKIFISYRRDDAKAEARSIYQHLERVYGKDSLFMDVDSIQKGLDFTKVLGKSLSETAVMLVVMGRTWLHQQDESGRRRLDDPADYVRLEITSALQRDIPVIPVRVDGARLPRVEELPDEIMTLVRRQGTSISHENFDSDVRGLEADLRKIVEPGSKSWARSWGAIAAGVAALAVAGSAGAWWAISQSPAPPSSTTTSVPSREAQVHEAAAAVIRQQEEERQRKEAEVRKRVDEEMMAEARRKAEAARLEAEAAARQRAEDEARRQLERARIEAEAEAMRKAHAEQEQVRKEAAAKAEEEKAKAANRARARAAEIEAAWNAAQQTNTLQAYLLYLRSYRDGSHREEARGRVLPLIRHAIEAQIDEKLEGLKRPDGTLSYFQAFPENPRAAAMCIDWTMSAPDRIWMISRGVSGHLRNTPIEDREQQALGICQNGRPQGAKCSCQVVRRNKDRTTQIPEDWIARQLD